MVDSHHGSIALGLNSEFDWLMQGSLALSQAGNIIALVVLIAEFVDELTAVRSSVSPHATPSYPACCIGSKSQLSISMSDLLLGPLRAQASPLHTAAICGLSMSFACLPIA